VKRWKMASRLRKTTSQGSEPWETGPKIGDELIRGHRKSKRRPIYREKTPLVVG
jgi:hypothetical protein